MADEKTVAEQGDAKLVLQTASAGDEPTPQKAGERGPKSALEGGEGSLQHAQATAAGRQIYSVQIHTDAKGLEVKYFPGESGDEAVNAALKLKGYKGVSIRGVQPHSDPDANSMGGERDAAIMFSNALNNGHLVNTLGTEANAEATEKLGLADVKELGE